MLNPTPSTRRLSTSTRPVPQAVHRDLNQKEAIEGLFEFIKEIGQKRSRWADKQPCGNGPARCDAAKHADVRLRSLLKGVGGILEGLSDMRRGVFPAQREVSPWTPKAGKM